MLRFPFTYVPLGGSPEPRRLHRFPYLLLIVLGLWAATPQAFRLQGDFRGVHDPAIARQANRFYVFSTGKAPGGAQLAIRCSDDLVVWRVCGHVFDSIPAWIQQESPATSDLWAPDVSFYRSEYRLYYAYSQFGKNTSGIALATNKTLDSSSPEYRWEDKGLVIRSTAEDDFNAIDPNFIASSDGKNWLAFGSFWSGIKMRELGPDGKPSVKNTKLYSLAARAQPANAAPAQAYRRVARWQAIEAPFIIRHRDFYYLFVSWDLCCQGTRSTYRIMAGRARKVTGPYLDRARQPMTSGGGSQILSNSQMWVGPGGASVLRGSPDDLLVFHAYDASTGQPALQISPIAWADGWPQAKIQ